MAAPGLSGSCGAGLLGRAVVRSQVRPGSAVGGGIGVDCAPACPAPPRCASDGDHEPDDRGRVHAMAVVFATLCSRRRSWTVPRSFEGPGEPAVPPPHANRLRSACTVGTRMERRRYPRRVVTLRPAHTSVPGPPSRPLHRPQLPACSGPGLPTRSSSTSGRVGPIRTVRGVAGGSGNQRGFVPVWLLDRGPGPSRYARSGSAHRNSGGTSPPLQIRSSTWESALPRVETSA